MISCEKIIISCCTKAKKNISKSKQDTSSISLQKSENEVSEIHLCITKLYNTASLTSIVSLFDSTNHDGYTSCYFIDIFK